MTEASENIRSNNGDVITACDILHSFFSAGLPNEHRKDLKKWRRYVINNEQYCHRHGARHLHSCYEETLQLIEAAEVLLQQAETISLTIILTDKDIHKEKCSLAYFPNNLSLKQLLNPYIIIKKFFKEYSVNEYKDLLHQWLLVALSNKSAGETITAKEIIDIYDNLRLLYSAAWLIYNRLCKVYQ